MTAPPLVATLIGFLEGPCRVRPGERGLLALSGGGDSMALLALMERASADLGLDLAAAVVDHGLRPESDAEARWTAAAARRRGLDCPILAVDAEARATRGGHSLEEGARLARHEALEGERRRRGARWVALGHTMSDQAETVVQRLHRGVGLDGLACMAPRRRSLVRPLLWASREELRAHLEELRWEWLEDPWNADRRFERVVVRQDVTGFVSSRRLADLASEAALLSSRLRAGDGAWLRAHRRRAGDAWVDFVGLASLPRPLRARALRAAVVPAVAELPPSRERTDALAADGPGGRRVQFQGGVAAFAAAGRGVLLARGLPRPPEPGEIMVDGPGSYRSDQLKMTAVVGGSGPRSPLWGTADLERPLEIRAPSPGDVLAESGQRLKRHLGRQMPWCHLRPWVPLLARGRRVLWTALRPGRSASETVVSLLLDADHPLRRWAT